MQDKLALAFHGKGFQLHAPPSVSGNNEICKYVYVSKINPAWQWLKYIETVVFSQLWLGLLGRVIPCFPWNMPRMWLENYIFWGIYDGPYIADNVELYKKLYKIVVHSQKTGVVIIPSFRITGGTAVVAIKASGTTSNDKSCHDDNSRFPECMRLLFSEIWRHVYCTYFGLVSL